MNKDERRAKVIEVLNKARSMELQAIHIYMAQHYKLDDMDLGELAVNMKLIAIDEMRHAEQFAERISELGGDPTTERLGKVVKGKDALGMFAIGSHEEDTTIDTYNQFLLTCREMGDSISVKLFELIIDEEQLHYNYFDNVHGHIESMGDTYLARIAGTPASSGLAPSGFVVAQGGGA